MLPAIDYDGRHLIELARIARSLPNWAHEQYGAVCPRCMSLHAAVVLHRFPDSARASFACGGCRVQRDASVDIVVVP